MSHAYAYRETSVHLEEREMWRRQVGNLLHADTPVFKNEEDSKPVRTVGPVGPGTE